MRDPYTDIILITKLFGYHKIDICQQMNIFFVYFYIAIVQRVLNFSMERLLKNLDQIDFMVIK